MDFDRRTLVPVGDLTRPPSVEAFPNWSVRCAAALCHGINPPAPSLRVSVRRYPAPVSEPGEESDSALRHLANDTEQPDTHPTDSASVLVCRRPPASSDAAHRRLAELRGHYTVLLVAVPLPDGVLVDLRNGPRFAVRPAAAEALLAPGPTAAAFSSALRAKPRPELLDHSGLLLDLGSHCRKLTIQKVPEPH